MAAFRPLRTHTPAGLAHVLAGACRERWRAYRLPVEVERALDDPPFTGDGRFEQALVRPLGGTVGFTSDRARTAHPGLPVELRRVEPGGEAVTVQADLAARAAQRGRMDAIRAGWGDTSGPWTCPRCQYDKNPVGRLRCARCRAEVGHLAQ